MAVLSIQPGHLNQRIRLKLNARCNLFEKQFRKLKALYMDLDIAKANREVQRWCKEINGMKAHGTTGQKPYEAFENLEKDKLKPIPLVHFEIATWKKAKVHVDQYIQFDKKFYSVPYKFVGKEVWVRATVNLIQIYHDHTLIKKHTPGTGKRQTDFTDFPENHRIMMQNKQVQHLIIRGEAIGNCFKSFITQILQPHAMINYRRALALLNLKEKYPQEILEKAATLAIQYQVNDAKQFQKLIHKLQQTGQEKPITISEKTKEIIRKADYFSQ